MFREDVERIVREARGRNETPDLQDADLRCVDLEDADLKGVDLRGAKLGRADLQGADLTAADLSGANLWCTALRFANLQGADLRGADLRGAALRGANLTGAILPDGVPVVPDIDAAILAAIEKGGQLEMSAWHTCETTHCRAGWAVVLAGDAGRALEDEFGADAAGALIYAASGSHPTPDWFAKNDAAMRDMRERANRAI